jgi:hypothetical protein
LPGFILAENRLDVIRKISRKKTVHWIALS